MEIALLLSELIIGEHFFRPQASGQKVSNVNVAQCCLIVR